MIKSQINSKRIVFLFCIGLGMICLAYLCTKLAYGVEYPQLSAFIFAGMAGSLGIYCLALPFLLNVYETDKEKIVAKSLLGFTKWSVLRSDILYYTEVNKAEEYKLFRRKVLKFQSKERSFRLSSYYVLNYRELRPIMCKGQKRNRDMESSWYLQSKKKLGISYFIYTLLFFVLSISFYFMGKTEVSQVEIISLSGPTLHKVQKQRSGGSRRNSYEIVIKLKDYPNFKFFTDADALAECDSKKLLKEVKAGDIIEIDIELDTYQKKLSRSKKLGFFDKHFNYKIIPVYAIRKGNTSYLSLDQYNRQNHKSSHLIVLIGVVLALLFTWEGYKVFRKIGEQKVKRAGKRLYRTY
ncbi:hypothetical protein [Marinifilum caeruleilacunae]|uniref:DUF3592 domain-containing protein n=1 Tax=Marinifilum caeruleilacunae TaxID=2499076 RepID=A0ABX1WUP8_9BACT|nr:hypothetical protein [Marinifilum caeruleilacunae]NOU59660.1 hypothetical protein [Marinifilum caeruleilacunae]